MKLDFSELKAVLNGVENEFNNYLNQIISSFIKARKFENKKKYVDYIIILFKARVCI